MRKNHRRLCHLVFRITHGRSIIRDRVSCRYHIFKAVYVMNYLSMFLYVRNRMQKTRTNRQTTQSSCEHITMSATAATFERDIWFVCSTMIMKIVVCRWLLLSLFTPSDSIDVCSKVSFLSHIKRTKVLNHLSRQDLIWVRCQTFLL